MGPGAIHAGSESVAERSAGGPVLPDSLSSILSTGDISTAFQPIVDLHSGQITAYEALTRIDPHHGYAHPGELFDVALRTGRIWELESLTRRVALASATALPSDVKLFLNTSPPVFADARFVDELSRCVAETPGLSPARVVIEITEVADEAWTERLFAPADALKAAGFGIAIDDVGAGTSGLNRIMRLRPHWLKLDREFTRGVENDAFRQNLISFFTHFARMSGVQVIAEGIETDQQLSSLANLGVRHGQGFLLARPAPIEVVVTDDFQNQVNERWTSAGNLAGEFGGGGEVGEGGTEPDGLVGRSLGRMSVRAPILSPGVAIADAADAIAGHPQAGGALVVDGHRLIGWCEQGVVRLAAIMTPEASIEGLVQDMQPLTLTPETTVEEAASALRGIAPYGVAAPIVVATGARIMGIVHPTSLLHELAKSAKHAAATPATDRVKADATRIDAERRFADWIANPDDASTPTSAAIVDIRRLGDCNELFGYEVGDRLIEHLGYMLRNELAAPGEKVYLAHLGDDRYVVAGDERVLEDRLRRLADRFEHNFASLRAPALRSAAAAAIAASAARFNDLHDDNDDDDDRGAPDFRDEHDTDIAAHIEPVLDFPAVSIRVLIVPQPARRLRSARQLFEIERQLRRRAAAIEADRPVLGSIFLTDFRHRTQQTGNLHRSAAA